MEFSQDNVYTIQTLEKETYTIYVCFQNKEANKR